jgi:hypothetical protein
MIRPTSVPPVLSPRVRLAVRCSALVCLAVAGLEALGWLWRLDWGAGGILHREPFPPFAALFNLIAGVNLLLLPGRTELRRARALAARQAAAAASGPITTAEAPAQPDSVRLGNLFGVLAVISFAPVFGPAAVVSGAVALAGGQSKGLIGLGLGLAGMIGWGVLLLLLP